MIKVETSFDNEKFDKFRKAFGETSNQALIRVGVQVAREAALSTFPKGRSKKAAAKNIVAGARKNIRDFPARNDKRKGRKGFDYLAKQKRPRVLIDRRWVSIGQDQVLRSPKEINDFIESNRNERGQVVSLPPQRKAICKKSDMNKVLVQRKRLAGVAKGSWIGAGMRLAKKARGKDRPRIGSKFISWAQKHADKGRMKLGLRRLGSSFLELQSKAPATRDGKIFSETENRRNIHSAWTKTLKWYRKAARELDK